MVHRNASVPQDVRPPAVEAVVNYLGLMRERPRFHLWDPGKDRNVMEPALVRIHNARPRREEFTLDGNGFELFDHRTALVNVRNSEDVRRIYEPELEQALLQITGAVRVIITRTVFVRVAQSSTEFGAVGTTYPAIHVHSDCTRKSGPAMVRALLDPDDSKVWLRKRFAVYSLWRAFSPPPQDAPIAVCDTRSVSAGDVVPTDVVIETAGAEMVYEGMSFRYSPQHRWCYFRDMHRDELLVIKAYDSDFERAWRVPHTGFLDSSAPRDAPPRLSIDVRAVAFFADEQERL
jgi:hypothetical protein